MVHANSSTGFQDNWGWNPPTHPRGMATAIYPPLFTISSLNTHYSAQFSASFRCNFTWFLVTQYRSAVRPVSLGRVVSRSIVVAASVVINAVNELTLVTRIHTRLKTITYAVMHVVVTFLRVRRFHGNGDCHIDGDDGDSDNDSNSRESVRGAFQTATALRVPHWFVSRRHCAHITRSPLHASTPLHCVIFTALHAMQTRSSDENLVCLSVCPSVKRVDCDKTEEQSVQIFILYERSFSQVFWEEEWLAEGDSFYLKFWVNRPPLERNRRFWQIIARSASAVTPSEKVQLTLIGSPLRAFYEPKMIIVRCP